MAIKFSQFNLRTDHTSGMYLVGYDGNQNIHITVDNLFDDFINGTENTIAMFGTGGTALVDSILSQDAGATLLTVAGQLNVDAAATFDTSITVTGDSTLNGNVTLGDASTDLITQTGTLYLNGPVKDTTDTLGDTDKILVSDGNGELTFQKLSETHVRSAELVVQSIKANEALAKGDPVYIVGYQVGQEVNIVAKADASNPAKMPATGIIDDDYASQAFGTMTAFGSFNTDFDASGGTENWSIGDILFVKAGGGLTNIKPTGSDLIQNVAIVSRNHQQTGELEVVALGRTNDIPNLTPGRLWIGSTGNTIESQTLFVDEANSRLGIGTASPATKLHIADTATPTIRIEDTTNNKHLQLFTDNNSTYMRSSTGTPIYFQTDGANTRMFISSGGQIQFSDYGSGTFTGTATKTLAVDASGNVIETAGVSVDGSGTANYVTKWLDTDTITDSVIYDDGTNVGIGTSSITDSRVQIKGSGNATNTYVDGLKVTSNNETVYTQYNWNGINNNTVLLFATGGTERMRIDSSGNVGIGVTPEAWTVFDPVLRVGDGGAFSGTDVSNFRMFANTYYDVSGYKRIGAGSATQYEQASGTHRWSTAATGSANTTISWSERMRIDSSGNVLINRTGTSGLGKLNVEGGADFTGGNVLLCRDTGSVGIGTSSPARLFHIDSGTATAWFRLQGGGGFGRYTEMYNNDDDFLLRADASNTGTSNGAINFAIGLTDGVSIGSSGQVTFWQYGSGTFTGTATKNLAVDSSGNVIETDGSIIDGSGTANYVSKWSDANTLTDSIIYDDGTDVGIGTATPNSKLQVNGSVQVADDTDTASADKVGALRYRTISTNSYVDMCMQTGATTYEWVNIVQNNW